MPKSKREELLKSASSKTRKRKTEDKEYLKESLVAENRKYKRALYTMELSDLEWLDSTAKELNKISRRKTSKSELIRAGIALMKEKEAEDLKEILKTL